MPNLIAKRVKYLIIVITLIYKFIQENKLPIASKKAKKTNIRLFIINLIDSDRGINPEIDEFFFKAQNTSIITSDLAIVFL